MDKEEIFLGDWQRILLGNAPLEFMLEVIIRSLFIYCLLVVVLRLLGKRMSGQLTITELAIMLSLGAIVAVPMETPERGVLQGVLLLFLILLFQLIVTYFIYRNEKFEDLAQGKMSLLVKDGVLQLRELDKLNVSREQLFAVLRNKQIFNLGRVKRLYQEAYGEFSIYRNQQAQPGLSIYPDADKAIAEIIQPADEGIVVCLNCGHTAHDAGAPCTVCHETNWLPAAIS
jgi:Predicted membrane protein